VAELDMKRIEAILTKAWPSLNITSLKHKYDNRTCIVDEDDGSITCVGCAHEWFINTVNGMGAEEIKFHFGLYDPSIYRIADDNGKSGHYKLELVCSGGEEQASASDVFGDD
jgi:hypothetical protein